MLLFINSCTDAESTHAEKKDKYHQREGDRKQFILFCELTGKHKKAEYTDKSTCNQRTQNVVLSTGEQLPVPDALLQTGNDHIDAENKKTYNFAQNVVQITAE